MPPFATYAERSLLWGMEDVTQPPHPPAAEAQNVLLAKAIALAATAFQGQLDKGGQPYVMHCLRVMNGVDPSDPQLQQAAVLHDLVEDCPSWTVAGLRAEGFSDRVCGLVALLTHHPQEAYPDYIDRLSADPLARAIKLADLRDNMNLARLKRLRPQDLDRLAKYHRAYVVLTGQHSPRSPEAEPSPSPAKKVPAP